MRVLFQVLLAAIASSLEITHRVISSRDPDARAGSGRYTVLGSSHEVATANVHLAESDRRMTNDVDRLVTPATEPESPCGGRATASDPSPRPTQPLGTAPPESTDPVGVVATPIIC